MAADLLGGCIGLLLIGVTLLDVFQTLFNPLRGGSLSHRVVNLIWRHSSTIRRNHRTVRSLTGPCFILAVILNWVISMIIGWALFYRIFLPEDGWLLTPGLVSDEQAGFVDAVYLSGVTLVTLGFGDITPTNDLLRLLVPVQGGLGFILLTAAITWVLGIYPPLARQQQLSQFLNLLERQLGQQGFRSPSLDQSEVPSITRDLTHQILAVRSDLLQFPITSYFHNPDPRSDLARTLHYLPYLMEQFPVEDELTQWDAARGLLQLACTDLIDAIGSRLLGHADEDLDVLKVYAELTGTTTEHYGDYGDRKVD